MGNGNHRGDQRFKCYQYSADLLELPLLPAIYTAVISNNIVETIGIIVTDIDSIK